MDDDRGLSDLPRETRRPDHQANLALELAGLCALIGLISCSGSTPRRRALGGEPLRRLLAALVLAGLLGLSRSPALAAEFDPASIPAGDYVLDARHASLVLTLPRVFGRQPTLRLAQLDGGFRYDPAQWRSTMVTLNADPRAIEASDGSLGRYAVRLFEPTKYPTIRFRSESLTMGPNGRGQLAGQLTFHGVTRPLTLDVAFRRAAEGPTQVRMAFNGTGRISRSGFGVTAGRPFVGDAVDLVFDIDFLRTPDSR